MRELDLDQVGDHLLGRADARSEHAVDHVDDAVAQLGEPRELRRFALQRHALQLVEDEVDALQPGLLEPRDLPPHEQIETAREREARIEGESARYIARA